MASYRRTGGTPASSARVADLDRLHAILVRQNEPGGRLVELSIGSRRLRLRPTNQSDQPLLDRLALRKEVDRFIGRVAVADEGAVLFTILRGHEPIGQVAIVRSSVLDGRDVEIACALVPEAEDGGFAWEACQLLMIWYFAEFRPQRILACVSSSNGRALRLAARLGMFLVGPRPVGDQLVYSWSLLDP